MGQIPRREGGEGEEVAGGVVQDRSRTDEGD